jgi:UDP-N-acetylglucosamine--N-acetylmuramyl-(pentapeptide) pyrophosphoryl-undecaprenol N-acetylglucosamine transferase
MIRVIISGGGTGGHVFPAIAIANALKATVPGIEILFIGARGRLEMEKVPAAGYPIEGLTVSGFQRRMTLKNLSFPFKLAGSLLKARSVIARFRPDVVVGVGGYASGPTLRMANRAGIPTLIQEQNSYPGVTNRLLAAKASRICVAYPGLEKYFQKEKLVLTGNPIRKDLTDLEGKTVEGRRFFGLREDARTILVIGGSLGAGTINKAIRSWIEKGPMPDHLQLIWQTGKNYYDELKNSINWNDCRLPTADCRLLPFIDRMDLAYASADVIVSRAGALAISELCVAGKPVILVPSPNVAEDHQTRNAEALTLSHAALMVKDVHAEESLGRSITDLLSDHSLQAAMRANIRRMAIPDAAEKIAREVIDLLPPQKRKEADGS